MYLAWYDASKKLSPQEKITNAYLRYQEKFGTEPTEVLVHLSVDVLPNEVPGEMAVIAQSNIAPNCFWIGTSEND